MDYTENMNHSEKLKDRKSKYVLLRVGNIILWIFVITTAFSIWHYVPVLFHAVRELDLSPVFDILFVAAGEFADSAYYRKGSENRTGPVQARQPAGV